MRPSRESSWRPAMEFPQCLRRRLMEVMGPLGRLGPRQVAEKCTSKVVLDPWVWAHVQMVWNPATVWVRLQSLGCPAQRLSWFLGFVPVLLHLSCSLVSCPRGGPVSHLKPFMPFYLVLVVLSASVFTLCRVMSVLGVLVCVFIASCIILMVSWLSCLLFKLTSVISFSCAPWCVLAP